MKKLSLLILLASTAFCLGDKEAEAYQAKLDQTYKAGVQYMNAGDYDNAERYFKALLKVKPNHGNARFNLMQLKDLRSTSRNNLSKNQLKGVMIKKIEFDAVPLNEAIEGLKILIDQQNGEENSSPNLVIQDPDKKITGKEISLSLSNIPATAALQYILDLSSARVSYSEHIITILPR